MPFGETDPSFGPRKALVESVGGTQEAFYWMQGKHDGFLIVAQAAAALRAYKPPTG